MQKNKTLVSAWCSATHTGSVQAGDSGGRWRGVGATELAPPTQVSQQSTKLFLKLHAVSGEAERRAISVWFSGAQASPRQCKPALSQLGSGGPWEDFVATAELRALTSGPSLISHPPPLKNEIGVCKADSIQVVSVKPALPSSHLYT